MTFGLKNCDYLATLGVLENTAGSPTMWFLGSVLFSVLFGSAGSMRPDKQIKKNPGDDVTLMCRDPEYEKIITYLGWSREDSEILFVFRDGRPFLSTHESFRNRVSLKDSQMKDGDLSVVLKNVTMKDTGTYECRVLHVNDLERELKLISTIYLSVVPPDKQIKKNPGDDVTLMCKDPEYKKDISLLVWRREDSEILFVFRDGQPFPDIQHKSFRNRVFLNDSLMKDGDLSVVLENVTINDTGTYQCRVRHEYEDPLILISTIHLSVVPPGDPSPGNQGGLSPGWIIGIVLSVLVLVPAAAVLWIYRKKKGSNQSSSGSNNQQNPEQDGLNSDP